MSYGFIKGATAEPVAPLLVSVAYPTYPEGVWGHLTWQQYSMQDSVTELQR